MRTGTRRLLGALGAAMFVGLTTTSCAGRMETTTRQRAAADFGCSESEVTVKERSSSGLAGEYEAQGCGRSEAYVARCSLFGICRAASSAEEAAREAEAARQREAYAQARAEQQASAPPPSSAPPPRSSSPEPSAPSYPENCSFDSNCDPGVKCNSRRCANTGGSKCGFDSDCGGNGAKCSGGKCSNAPDGKCAYDSHCPGGKCGSGGKCKF